MPRLRPDTPFEKIQRSRWFGPSLVVLVVLLLAGAGAGLYWNQFGSYFKKSNPATATQDPNWGAIKPTKLSKSIDTAINGDYATVQKNLEAEASAQSTPLAKAQAYNDLAQVASSVQNHDDALAYAQKSIDTTPTANAYALQGFAYEAKGQWRLASQAFAKAAELSPKTGLDVRSDYTYYLQESQMDGVK